MFNTRAADCFCVGIVMVLSTASVAQQPAAKDYPSKPIRMVVPFVPGGIDVVGHALGRKISPVIGQNMFIDNRAGAGGVIGTDIVAKAAPDGYTLLWSTPATLLTPVYLVKSLPFDSRRDFTPISIGAEPLTM